MSSTGKKFVAFLFVLVAALTAGAFMFLGLEYGAVAAALGIVTILVLILGKFAGRHDGMVYLAFIIVLMVAGIHFAPKGFGNAMVSSQLANAGWVTIDSQNYSVRGSEFGTYTTAAAGGSTFQRVGWFVGDQMIFNGKVYGVFATFNGLPIVATAGIGDHHSVIFTQR